MKYHCKDVKNKRLWIQEAQNKPDKKQLSFFSYLILRQWVQPSLILQQVTHKDCRILAIDFLCATGRDFSFHTSFATHCSISAKAMSKFASTKLERHIFCSHDYNFWEVHLGGIFHWAPLHIWENGARFSCNNQRLLAMLAFLKTFFILIFHY